jgi:RHS repeat-associated protein
VRQQFTQKERDIETGLDYFLARYYSSTQGRFTSPDEFRGGPEELFGEIDPHDPLFYAEIAEPQSLNNYHYVLNNPLRYIDPDGHQTTTADNIKQRVTDFVIGVGRGISSSLTFGASGAPRPDDSLTNRAGQGLGTVATSVGGVLLFNIGAGSDVLSGGALTKVSVVAVTTGVVTVAGATTNAVNVAATPMQRNSTSNDSSDEPQNKRKNDTQNQQSQQTGRTGGRNQPKDRSVERATDNLKGLKAEQRRISRRGGYRIRTKKAEQNIDNALKKLIKENK